MSVVSDFMDNYSASLYDIIVEYVDAEYSLWLSWFLTPVIVTFLLPAVIILLIYVSSIIFHLYRLYRLRVVSGGNGDWRQAARLAVCALWDAHGWLWHGKNDFCAYPFQFCPAILTRCARMRTGYFVYREQSERTVVRTDPSALPLKAIQMDQCGAIRTDGYEIKGLENIPEGPCLFIYYHGALPIDMYYFSARMFLFKRSMVHTVADRFMFKIPGWRALLEGLCVIPGTVQTCAGVLRGGASLAISPGGVHEAQFGDHCYTLEWKARVGFAKVAQEAKVPIVPMFTKNVREAFRTVGFLRGLARRVYAATRVPLTPVYGGFPVKLVTHLGKPIPYDPDLTPDQLQKKVRNAIEDLIEEHQRVPGNILTALLERVIEMPKKPKKVKKQESNGKLQNGEVKKIENSALSDSVEKKVS